MFRGYLINRLYLQKINLKRPLSRGSRFKIYFRLEYQRYRGSRQNFHEILFSKDRILIKPNHFITWQIHHHIIMFKKSNNLNSNVNAKIRLRKLNNSYQEYDLKQELSLVPIFLFFVIFCDFRETKYISR